MKLHIDKLGRIVVPKRLRDGFDLGPDVVLELQEHADGFDWDDAVNATRQERQLSLDRL